MSQDGNGKSSDNEVNPTVQPIPILKMELSFFQDKGFIFDIIGMREWSEHAAGCSICQGIFKNMLHRIVDAVFQRPQEVILPHKKPQTIKWHP